MLTQTTLLFIFKWLSIRARFLPLLFTSPRLQMMTSLKRKKMMNQLLNLKRSVNTNPKTPPQVWYCQLIHWIDKRGTLNRFNSKKKPHTLIHKNDVTEPKARHSKNQLNC